MIGTLLLVLYQIGGTLAFVLAAPWILLRASRRRREMRERLGGGSGARRREAEGPLWMHAASLGELAAVRALLLEPHRDVAGPKLLTVLSVSVRDAARDLEASGWRVRFAPIDLWFCLLPFLRRERPRGLILLETELWPATLALCRARGVPVAVISGRLSARRWKGTALLRPLLAPLLRGVEGCCAQSEADAARFRALGATRVTVCGNLKYRLDEATEEATEEARATGAPAPDGAAEAPAGGAPFLFTAGSLRRGEEAVLEAIRESGVAAVVAPRHGREREEWARACRARGLRAIPRSAADLPVPERGRPGSRGERERLRRALIDRLAAQGASVLLLDTHGELAAWYAAADAAYVGGTLCAIGGHNLFEPAREGIPVAFGPHTAGVRDLAEPLLRLGGGTEVRDAKELAAWLRAMREDDALRRRGGRAAAAAASEVAGAAARTWEFLSALPWVGVEDSAKGADANGPAAAR